MPARRRREIPRVPGPLWGYGRRTQRWMPRQMRYNYRYGTYKDYLRRRLRRIRHRKLKFHQYHTKKPQILKSKHKWVLTLSKRRKSRKKIHWRKKHPHRRRTLKKRLF